jgi:ubiquitin carboxyl-terminal hydrolase 14
MMMGTASTDAAVIIAPKEKMKFAEDMTEAEAAKLEGAIPAGLQNLGNTCYLNSTLQVLKSMPEMQEELAAYVPSSTDSNISNIQNLSQFGLGGLGSSIDLTSSLRDLYKQMSETQDGFLPLMFLNTLRTVYPQFAQRAKNGHGYAQQDAEEAWSQIVSQLRQNLKGKQNADGTRTASFVDRYMSGAMVSSLSPPTEAAEKEEAVISTEAFLKLDCHIDVTINHLRDGLAAGLKSEIEKRSESLNGNAIYTKTSKISRLPKYLTIHLVRFFWKREAEKKAKIMRKVTFPPELDLVEFCTDDLKKLLIPVRDKVRDIRKDEQDIDRARKRQKLAHKQEEDRKADAAKAEAAPIAKARDAKEKKEAEISGRKEEESSEVVVYKTDAEYEAERQIALKAAKKELFELIDPTLAADDGANKSGVYELRGVVTHQGGSADSGHYTSFVKKAARTIDDPKAPGGKRKEEDGKWWWFNDDKVSEVEPEKIETLAGGGESASALILLYRALDLPTKHEIEE